MGSQKLTLYNNMKLWYGTYSNTMSLASFCDNTKVDTTVDSRFLRCDAVLLDEWLLKFWKILVAYLHRGQALQSSLTAPHPWRRRQKQTADNYSPYVTCQRTQSPPQQCCENHKSCTIYTPSTNPLVSCPSTQLHQPLIKYAKFIPKIYTYM